MPYFRFPIPIRLLPPGNTILVVLAVVVGLATAGFVWLFRYLIERFAHLFGGALGAEGVLGQALAGVGLPPELALVITLALAGLVVGVLMYTVVGHERYHGVAGIMEAVALAGGRLRYNVMPLKAVASALSLGAGASVGPEDPSVQIGANVGSFLGRKLHLSEERTKILVAAGAASAIAAAFNAPIAGVFFAIEIILGQFSTSSMGVIILAAVISSAFTQSLAGANPIFGDLDYALGGPAQLPFYALLGLVLAGISTSALWLFEHVSGVWRWFRVWPPLRTALTGAVVGAVGIFLPELLGPGEGFMHDVLNGHAQVAALTLLGLGLGKLVLTALSLSGGFVGGVFAPTLFMGIVVGSAYGLIVNDFVPLDLGNPQAYAIAGMAGLLAGVVRAPITAILLVFEITDDYLLILPIMLTAVTCSIIMEWVGRPGIYLGALERNGLRIQQGRDVDVMQGVRVGEAMKRPAPCIPEGASLADLRAAFHAHNTRALCVVNAEGDLTGIVTLGDLQRAYEAAQGGHTAPPTVCEVCSRDVLTTTPDETLWTAAQQMGARDIGRLPVIDANGRPVGILRRHDLVKAYNLAVSRKFHDQHYAEQIRLNTISGAHIVEYEVRPGSPVAGALIRDVAWPTEAVIASINRNRKLIIPHGNTLLHAYDRVTVVTDTASEARLAVLFGDGTPRQDWPAYREPAAENNTPPQRQP